MAHAQRIEYVEMKWPDGPMCKVPTVNGYAIRETAIKLGGGRTRAAFELRRPGSGHPHATHVAGNFTSFSQAAERAAQLPTMYEYMLPSGATILLTEAEAAVHPQRSLFC